MITAYISLSLTWRVYDREDRVRVVPQPGSLVWTGLLGDGGAAVVVVEAHDLETAVAMAETVVVLVASEEDVGQAGLADAGGTLKGRRRFHARSQLAYLLSLCPYQNDYPGTVEPVFVCDYDCLSSSSVPPVVLPADVGGPRVRQQPHQHQEDANEAGHDDHEGFGSVRGRGRRGPGGAFESLILLLPSSGICSRCRENWKLCWMSPPMFGQESAASSSG